MSQKQTQTTEDKIQKVLKPLIEECKKTCFVEGYKATDEEILGIILSKYFKWDGVPLLKVLVDGLEDANFHTWNGKLIRFFKKELKVEVDL